MRTGAGRTIADCGLRELQNTFRIRDGPGSVFFGNCFVKLRKNFSFQSKQALVVKAAHVDFHFAVSSDGVHRRTALDRTHCPSGLGVGSRTQIGKLLNGTGHCVNGTRGLAVFGKAVTAQAVDADAPAVRARGTVEHTAYIGGVHCDKAVNLIVLHQVLGAADIAVTFFTHGTHKPNVTLGLDVSFFQTSENLQNSTQAGTVIADAGSRVADAVFFHGHIGINREHRVHVGAQHQNRTAFDRTLTNTDHIADIIHSDIG